MTLPYTKRLLAAASETGVPVFKLEIDGNRVGTSACEGLGLIKRTGMISQETAKKIMRLIDKDKSGVSYGKVGT